MNSRVDRDVFGKKALQKPETLTIIGGYFHGQQYTFKDRDTTNVILIKPAFLPVNVSADPNEEIPTDMRQFQQTYTRMKCNGHPFLVCIDITEKERTEKINEYFRKGTT